MGGSTEDARGLYGDIAIVLKTDTCHHPDFSVTMGAGTSYHSERVRSYRPWGKSGVGASSRPAFDRAKVNFGVPDWEYALAAEVASVTSLNLRSGPAPIASVTLASAQQYFREHNSHDLLEAHLPPTTPLDYIDRVR